MNSTLLLARNSSPRPVYSSAQPQSVPGVPNSRVSLECSTPESPWIAQRRVSLKCPTQSLPGVPNPILFLECRRVPGLPSPRVSLECPTPEYLYQERVEIFEVKYLFVCLLACLFVCERRSVCVCERERERVCERECVCVRVCVCAIVQALGWVRVFVCFLHVDVLAVPGRLE